MTFKEFVKWCNERACDGRWGLITAAQCLEVIRDIRSEPFWKREKAWRCHHMHNTVMKMVLKTNQKIAELCGERIDNG